MGKSKSKASSSTNSLVKIYEKLNVKKTNSHKALAKLPLEEIRDLMRRVKYLKYCFESQFPNDSNYDIETDIDDLLFSEEKNTLQTKCTLFNLFELNSFLDGELSNELATSVEALLLEMQQLCFKSQMIFKDALGDPKRQEKMLINKQQKLNLEFSKIHISLESMQGAQSSLRCSMLDAIARMLADRTLREHMITLSQPDITTPFSQWLYNQLLERGIDVNPQLSQITESMGNATLGT